MTRKSIGQHRARFHLIADRSYVTPQFLVRQLVGKKIQPLQNREPGFDQGDELLVEHQELLEVDGLPALGNAA